MTSGRRRGNGVSPKALRAVTATAPEGPSARPTRPSGDVPTLGRALNCGPDMDVSACPLTVSTAAIPTLRNGAFTPLVTAEFRFTARPSTLVERLTAGLGSGCGVGVVGRGPPHPAHASGVSEGASARGPALRPGGLYQKSIHSPTGKAPNCSRTIQVTDHFSLLTLAISPGPVSATSSERVTRSGLGTHAHVNGDG